MYGSILSTQLQFFGGAAYHLYPKANVATSELQGLAEDLQYDDKKTWLYGSTDSFDRKLDQNNHFCQE